MQSEQTTSLPGDQMGRTAVINLLKGAVPERAQVVPVFPQF